MTLLRSCLLALLAAPGLLGAGLAVAQAQQQDIRFENLSVDDGLAHNNVFAIAQDHDGFMWFGTEKGLSKYDGHDVAVYRHDVDNPNSLSNEWISAVLVDQAGTLWAGTDDGLNRFDPRTETFTRYLHDPDDPASVSDNYIKALYEDRDGLLWVGTDNGGLNRFNPETETFTHFLPLAGDTTSLSSRWVQCIYQDRAGTLWVGTGRGGLDRFDAETETFTRYDHDPNDARSLSYDVVNALYEDRAGTLWVGTGRGLNRFDPHTETFTRFLHDPADANSLSHNRVNTLHEDRDGLLWVGTRGGLNRFDPHTETFTRFLHDPGTPNALSRDDVRIIYEDRGGVLWVGTHLGGLNRFDPTIGYFTHYRHDRANPNSLNDNAVSAIYADPAEPAVLWVGTVNGGLNRFDRATGRFTHFMHSPARPASLSYNFVEAIYRDRAGTLWVGTQGGLNRMRPDGRSFTHFLEDNDNSLLKWIRVIHEDTDEAGVLWLANGLGGLLRFETETAAYTRYTHDPATPHSISSNWISSIYQDPEGLLWLGTEGGGLNRFDPATERFTRYTHDPNEPTGLASNDVFGLYRDPADTAGTLWLGTARGLARFDPATETFTHFTVENSGLPNNTVYGVLGDDSGALWLSSLGGLSRFDPAAETFQNYDVERGVQARAFNNFAYHKSQHGELFFGGTGGFNAFFPERIRTNRNAPDVVITDVKLFSDSPTPGPTETHVFSTTTADAVTFSHRENDLLFEYVGLHFGNPSKNRYAFRLEHYEEEWHYVDTQRAATYTNLDPGAYVFQVIAANSDGVWSEDGAALRVVINPPWWQTTWAYILYALLLIASVVSASRLQRARLLRKEREHAQIREAKLRAEAAELQTKAVEAEAKALHAENERKEHELKKARELENAYRQLEKTHRHLKATQAQLIQAEKMASLGQLTAGIAHEIKNPLNFVNNFAEVNVELAGELLDRLHTDTEARLADVKETLDDLRLSAQKINEQGKRADGIVKSMMRHARGTTGNRTPTDLNALLDEYVTLAYHGLRAREPGFDVTIKRDYQDDLAPARVASEEIARVFLNLLDNAFYAVQNKAQTTNGPYTPTVSVHTRSKNDEVEIRIWDNGTGIPAQVRQKIFQPFFTTKPTGAGTGLGLSLSYEIVQRHGGKLGLLSKEGVFTEFVVRLPHEA